MTDSQLSLHPDPGRISPPKNAWQVAEYRALVAAIEAAIDGNEPPSDSFDPVDLDPYLVGTAVQLRADMLVMTDGRALLHRARLNGVHGDATVGKSWLMVFLIAEQVNAGHVVMLIDLEDTPQPTIERLRQIGVSDRAISERLVFVRPDEAFTSGNVERLIGHIEERKVAHVILDSLGEAFSLEGLNEDRDVEVAPWLSRVCRVVIERTDAGFTLIDHGTKAAEKPLDPSGSKRKRAAITGTAWLMTAKEPFDRATGGVAALRCAKDRHGWFKRGDTVAALVMGAVDPVGRSSLRLEPQLPPAAAPTSSPDLDVVVVTLRAAHPKALSRRGLVAAVRHRGGQMSDGRIAGAVELAVSLGLAEESFGPNRARLFRAVLSASGSASQP
jgi:hypothetical protein